MKLENKAEEVAAKIYIASKTKHADKWLKLRDNGVNIISTWIDEAGEGMSPDLSDLCRRCVNECKACDAMIVYSEEGDYLKGAFIEMGIALSVFLKPIYLVGTVLPHGSVFTYSHQVFSAKSVEQAIELINTNHLPATPSPNKEVKSKEEILTTFRPMTNIYPGVDNDLIYAAMEEYANQFKEVK